MFRRHHEDRVNKNSSDDRRYTRERVDHEPHRTTKPPASNLRQVNADTNSEGQTESRGDQKQQERSDNRISDSATFTNGARTIDQKLPVEGADSLPGDVPEDHQQRADRHQRAERRQRSHECAVGATYSIDVCETCCHQAALPTPPVRRVTFQTSTLAMPLTMNVTRKRISPSSTRALR